MFTMLIDLAAQARTFILAVGVVVWLGATLAVAVTRRSVLIASATFFAGAFLMWGMYNSDVLRDKAGIDLKTFGGRPSAVVVVDDVAQ